MDSNTNTHHTVIAMTRVPTIRIQMMVNITTTKIRLRNTSVEQVILKASL